MIGSGDGVPQLKKRADELGLSNMTFLPSVPVDQVNEHVRLLDVCLSTQTDDLVGWVRTTGKLPLYLANERFIIATDVGEASWVLPPQMRLAYHGTVDRTYPRRLAERLREIALNPSLLDAARAGPARVRQHFDARQLSYVLAAELHQLERRTSDA